MSDEHGETAIAATERIVREAERTATVAAMHRVATVLKRHFTNLTVEQTISISAEIVLNLRGQA